MNYLMKFLKVNHASVSSFPTVLTFSSGEKLRYLKVKLVLQYHVPNQHEDTEGYAHHLLIMFYQFHDESQLKMKIDNPPSYCTKCKQPGVIDIVHQNKALIETFSELVEAAFEDFRMNLVPN